MINGALVSQKRYGASGKDFGRGSVLAGDGSLVMAGQTDSFGAGSDDVWVFKLNLDGTLPNFGVDTQVAAVTTTVLPVDTTVTGVNTSVAGVTSNSTKTAVNLTVQSQAP